MLVVGCGQSGAQIAEDLHLAGRQVVLATGNAPRCARFYRGKEVVDCTADARLLRHAGAQHPLREGVGNATTTSPGATAGAAIDLRRFAREGMQLYGQLEGFEDGALQFLPNLRENLAQIATDHLQRHQRLDRQAHRRQGHRGRRRRSVYSAELDAAGRAHAAGPRGVGHHERRGASAPRRTSPGSMRPCSTAAAIRCTCAA